MKVGKLKELIKDLADDTPILVPSPDHSYFQASCRVGPAELCNGSYYEYFDDRSMFVGSKKVEKTLIIGDN